MIQCTRGYCRVIELELQYVQRLLYSKNCASRMARLAHSAQILGNVLLHHHYKRSVGFGGIFRR